MEGVLKLLEVITLHDGWLLGPIDVGWCGGLCQV